MAPGQLPIPPLSPSPDMDMDGSSLTIPAWRVLDACALLPLTPPSPPPPISAGWQQPHTYRLGLYLARAGRLRPAAAQQHVSAAGTERGRASPLRGAETGVCVWGGGSDWGRASPLCGAETGGGRSRALKHPRPPPRPSSQAIAAAKLPTAATAAGKHGRSTSNVPLMPPPLPAVAAPAGHTRTPSMPGPAAASSQAALDPRSVTLSAAEAAAAQGQPLPQPGSASAAAPAGGLDPLQWLLQVCPPQLPHTVCLRTLQCHLHKPMHYFIPHTHMPMHTLLY